MPTEPENVFDKTWFRQQVVIALESIELAFFLYVLV